MVIFWELCKWLEFVLTDKLYKHKTEFVLENETHKILLDIFIQMAHLISPTPNVRRKKKEERVCHLVDFVVQTNNKVKIKDKQIIGFC